jgi:hypothetical protein
VNDAAQEGRAGLVNASARVPWFAGLEYRLSFGLAAAGGHVGASLTSAPGADESRSGWPLDQAPAMSLHGASA